MAKSNIFNSDNSLQSIYFQDYIKNGPQKNQNLKEIAFIIIAHICAIGIGAGSYFLIRNVEFPSISRDNPKTNSKLVKNNEDYYITTSETSVLLNMEDNEIATIDVSVSNPEKIFNIKYANSSSVSVEIVENNNGTIKYAFTPKSVGSGYIDFYLLDVDDESKVYDVKRVNITVESNDINSMIPESAAFFNGSYYQLYSDVASSWEEAEKYCENLGGHLAVINNSEENNFLYSYMTGCGYKSAYFGYIDSSNNGIWRWIDNSDSNYTNWANGEPNSYSEPYGMFYYKFTDGKWNDGVWGDDTTAFICEWDNNTSTSLSNDSYTSQSNPSSLSTHGIVITQNDPLNVRKQPSADSEKIGEVAKGSTVTIIDTIGDWYQIDYGNQVGYVSQKYISILNQSNDESLSTNISSCSKNGTINSKGAKYVYSYTTDYVCNGGRKVEERLDLEHGWHITAKNMCYSYDLTWYEVWDTDDGDYYGWVDEAFISFY